MTIAVLLCIYSNSYFTVLQYQHDFMQVSVYEQISSFIFNICTHVCMYVCSCIFKNCLKSFVKIFAYNHISVNFTKFYYHHFKFHLLSHDYIVLSPNLTASVS